MQNKEIMVLVPLSDIRAVEEERQKLYTMAEKHNLVLEILPITGRIWNLTHRRYLTSDGMPRPD